MALPTGWPRGVPSNRNTLRFYQTGTLTANFSDNAYFFGNFVNASEVTGSALTAYSWGIRITAVGGDIEFSFDGTAVHGKVLSGTTGNYYHRQEAGIAVRGTGTFYIEAW